MVVMSKCWESWEVKISMLVRVKSTTKWIGYVSFHSSTLRFLDYSEPDALDPQMRYIRNDIPDALRLRDYMYKIPYSPQEYSKRKSSLESTRFVDLKVVKLASGKGGDGRVSFLRDANRAVGPPDGGDGGKGGAIYVQAVEGMTSLHKIRYMYKAEDGRPGSGSHLQGKNGANVVLQVPVGTIVKWIPDPKSLDQDELESISEKGLDGTSIISPSTPIKAYKDLYETGPGSLILPRQAYDDGKGWIFKDKDEEYQNSKDYFQRLRDKVKYYDLINRRQELYEDMFPIEGLDLDDPNRGPVLLLQGGRGGMGNMHFQTPIIRNPRFAKQGRGKVEQYFLLELRLLADLGLVGLPNAGKSSLLRAISNARPRVGHWEFTTLNPTIGTVPLGITGQSFTVADIPGIVKDASLLNKGRGTEFLRHVERSKGLVFIIALDTHNPCHDLDILVNELGKRMENKRVLVIGTKADVNESKDKYTLLKNKCNEHGWSSLPCCAVRQENIEAVIQQMAKTSGIE